MKFILLLFLFTFVTSITNADSTNKSLLYINCLENADHPINKTGGTDWDLINVNKAFEI